jgi:regulator of RNase E activity RraA
VAVAHFLGVKRLTSEVMMPTELTPEQLRELASFDSPTLANAIEAFKVRDPTEGYVGKDVHCLTPELGLMCGYAVTCTVDTTTPGRTGDRRAGQVRLYEAIAASPKPAVIVMQDTGPRPSHGCHIGDVMVSIAHRLGAIGVVTAGGVRDLDGIRPLRFHVFASGLVVAHGTYTILEVGVPVEVSRLPVRPGDLLHGDASGVVAIPLEIADRLAAECRKVRERELALKDFTHSPDFSLEALRKRLLG